jgi:hypothetical protein
MPVISCFNSHHIFDTVVRELATRWQHSQLFCLLRQEIKQNRVVDRHRSTQHNDIQHNDTQHKGPVCDTQHK